ncbi:MAG TPA: transporter substrate-binding domain-containing protein [Acholeplasmataceae bacterium]|jgi:NitT/TauT family transport system substrate-binding protein|nr:transporter substrate-binding domain-containing protein [Bacilli bacterium]HHV14320.1 transporter substrate-binding domain-containing protein [Acholeplasmataceae bacterium]
MKRIINFFLLLFSFVFLTGCSEDAKLKVTLPNGIPLISVAGTLTEDIEYNNVTGPNLLVTAFTSKEADIIIAPINLGAKLYNSGNSSYKLDSVIGFLNTYIVSIDEPLTSLADLNGKTLAAFGETNIPGITLRSALASENVNPNITYYNAINDGVAFFLNGDYQYLLTSEPVLSNLRKKVSNLKYLSIADVLHETTELDLVPQAAIFVNSESKNTRKIASFITAVENNITNLNKDPQGYANFIYQKDEYLESMKEGLIASSIPLSNIEFKKAIDIKEDIEKFFNLLLVEDAALVGGKLPDQAFYTPHE